MKYVLLTLTALILSSGCVSEDPRPQEEPERVLEVLCGGANYYVVLHENGVIYKDWDRGQCPEETHCVAGFSDMPCQ